MARKKKQEKKINEPFEGYRETYKPVTTTKAGYENRSKDPFDGYRQIQRPATMTKSEYESYMDSRRKQQQQRQARMTVSTAGQKENPIDAFVNRMKAKRQADMTEGQNRLKQSAANIATRGITQTQTEKKADYTGGALNAAQKNAGSIVTGPAMNKEEKPRMTAASSIAGRALTKQDDSLIKWDNFIKTGNASGKPATAQAETEARKSAVNTADILRRGITDAVQGNGNAEGNRTPVNIRMPEAQAISAPTDAPAKRTRQMTNREIRPVVPGVQMISEDPGFDAFLARNGVVKPDESKSTVEQLQDKYWVKIPQVKKDELERITFGAYNSGMNPTLWNDEQLNVPTSKYAAIAEEKQAKAQEAKDKFWNLNTDDYADAVFDFTEKWKKTNEETILNGSGYTTEEKANAANAIMDLDRTLEERKAESKFKIGQYYQFGFKVNSEDQEELRRDAFGFITGESYDEWQEKMNPADQKQMNVLLDAVIDNAKARIEYSEDEMMKEYAPAANVAEAYRELIPAALEEQRVRGLQKDYEKWARNTGHSPTYDPSLHPEPVWVTNTEGDRIVQPQGTDLDQIYFWMNNPDAMGGMEDSLKYARAEYFVPDEQRELFNMMYRDYKLNGTPIAREYWKGMEPMMEYMLSQYQMRVNQMTAETPVVGTAARLAGYPMQVIGGAMGLAGSALALAGNKDAAKSTSGWYIPTKSVRDTRQQQNQEIAKRINDITGGKVSAKFGNFLMNVADSMIDNIMAMGVARTLTNNEITNRTMDYIQVIMSGEATSNAMVTQLENGRDPYEAAAYAIGIGLIEGATERWSLEQIIRPDVRGILGSGLKKAAFVGKSFMAEGSEEVAADLGEIFMDSLFGIFHSAEDREKSRTAAAYAKTGADSLLTIADKYRTEMEKNYNAKVRANVAAGMDDEEATRTASREVLAEKAEEIGQSFMAGGLSGGLLGAGRLVTTTADVKASGKNISDRGRVKELIEVGLGTSKTSDGYALATELQEKLDKGEQLTEKEIGKLKFTLQEDAAEVLGKARGAEIALPKTTKSAGVLDSVSAIAGESAGARGTSAGMKMASMEDESLAEGTKVAGVRGIIHYSDKASKFGKLIGIRNVDETVKDKNGKETTRKALKYVIEMDGKEIEVDPGTVQSTDYRTAVLLNRITENPGLYSEKFTKMVIQEMEKDQGDGAKVLAPLAESIRIAAFTGAEMPTMSLPEELASRLYNESKQEYADIRDREVTGSRKAAGTGSAIYKGLKYGTAEYQAKVKEDGLSRETRNKMGMAAELARRIGTDIWLADEADLREERKKGTLKYGGKLAGLWGIENYSTDSFDGIVLNIEGKKLGAKGFYDNHNILVTFGHEFTHWLQRHSRQGYDNLERFVLEEQRKALGGQGQLAAELTRIMQDQDVDLAGAISELVADSCDQILSNEKVIRHIENTNKTLYGEIRDFAKDLYARIWNAIAEMTGSMSNAARRIMQADMDRMAELFNFAWDEATGKVVDAAETEGAESTTRMSTAQLDDQIKKDNKKYEGKKLYADSDVYDHEFLKNLHPIQIVQEGNIDDAIGEDGNIDESKLANNAMKNAIEEAEGEKHSNVVLVKNEYTGKMMVLTQHGIVHSVHTDNNITNRANARIALKAGLLAKHAVPINGLRNEANIEGTYAMAAPVIGEDGKLEKVAILTIEVRTDNLVNIEEYDKVHAISGRKKNAGRKMRVVIPNGPSDNPRSFRMSITDFLDEINSTHRGILSQDVLDYYEEERPTEGYWAERAKFSAAYDQAVKDGDVETQQRLVDEAAKRAGYIPLKLFHGTRAFGFTEFNVNGSGGMIFTTDDRQVAETYSNTTSRSKISERSNVDYTVMSGEELLREAKRLLKNKYKEYELTTKEQREEATKEARDTLQGIADEITDIIKQNADRLKDNTRRRNAENIVKSLIEISKATNDEEYDKAREYYDSAKWTFKWEDEDLLFEMLSDERSRQIYQAMNELSDFMYDGNIYIRDGNAHDRVFDNQLILELDAEQHKGVYELYGKPGRQLVIDAEGSNWNSITPPAELNLYGPQRTRDIADAAKALGYDSIQIKNLKDSGGETAYNWPSTVTIFFNENQLKSADPMTYDEDGNVIPLDERFNPEKTDIRYSAAQIDQEYDKALKEGNTEKQQELVYEAGRKAGYTIKAYHGTARGDRVGNVFLPERATSGPMAYFTDNREIAENYARDKQDTSIAYDENYGDYDTQFRFKLKNGKDIPVVKLWSLLSFADRQKITEAAKHITLDDEAEEIIWDENAKYGVGNFTDYERKLHGYNSIRTLMEGWLYGGTLFDREGDFIKVLEMAGIKGVTWNNPDERHEKVYDVLLRIQNPFVVKTMYTEEFLDGLEKWWQQQDQKKYQKENASADLWDKNNITVEKWIEDGHHDIEHGYTSNWTRIPDAVSDYLRSLGYDGIQDNGGKGGGEVHTVWIPFSSEQIKSAEPITYDDQGNVIPLSERFNTEKTDIRYSKAENNTQYSSATADSLDVEAWMEARTPGSFRTEDERIMWQAWKKMKSDIRVIDHALQDYRQQVQQLEAKGEENLTWEEKEKLRRLRNKITVKQAQLDRLQKALAKSTSEEGFATMMREANLTIADFLEGKTQQQVQSAVDTMMNQVERAEKDMATQEKALARLGAESAVKTVRSALRSKGLAKTVDALRTQYSTTMSRDELEGRMAEIILKTLKGEDVTADIEALAADVAGNQMGYGAMEADEALGALRGRTIVIGPGQQAELKANHLTLADIRRRTKGSGIKFVYGETSTLDTDAAEIEQAAPALQGQLDNEKASLENFVSYVENLLAMKKGNAAENGVDVAKVESFIGAMTQLMLNEEIGGMSRADLIDRIKKDAGKIGTALNAVRAIQGQLTEIRERGTKALAWTAIMKSDMDTALQYYDKVARKAAQQERTEVRKALIEQLRGENTQKLMQQREKYEEMIKNDRNARKLAEENKILRNKINTAVKRISRLMTQETDLKNIPEEAKPLARLLVKMFVDHDSNYRRVTNTDFQDLKRMQQTLEAWQNLYGDFDFNHDLDWLIEGEGENADTTVRDEVEAALINIEDGLLAYRNAEGKGVQTLQERRDALTKVQENTARIYNVIRATQRAFIKGQAADVAHLAAEARAEMMNSRFKGEWTGVVGRSIGSVRRGLVYGNTTPVYFFKNLKNRVLSSLFENYQDAENRNGLEIAKARETLRQIAEETGYSTWDQKKRFTIQLAKGDTVQLTLGEMMSLYATWTREVINQEMLNGPEKSFHLELGGFLTEPETKKGIAGRQIMDQRPHKVTEADIEQIKKLMTKEQIQYVDRVVRYMTKDIGELGNEASMQMYGIKKFNEKWYFPFEVWDGTQRVKSNVGAQSSVQNRVAHSSFTKRRTNAASNPLVIRDFTQTAARHIVAQINYNTFAPAIEWMQRVMNLNMDEGSGPDDMITRNTWAVFRERYGMAAEKYLKDFQKDMNGGATQERTGFDKLLSIFRKNAVAGSLSVALQQPLSYIRAAMEISPRWLTEAMNPRYYAGSAAEMEAHSGVAVLKQMGKFDIGIGETAAQYISPEARQNTGRRIYDRASDITTALPNAMDRMTWTRLWTACKLEQANLHPEMKEGSEEFMQLVTDRFNDIIRKTQVYDSTLVRSKNMRSTNWGARMMTSFMAEPTLTANVLADSILNVKDAGGRARLAKAGATFILSAIMQSLVKGLMGAGRNPDKKKTWYENVAYRFMYNFISEANPLSLIPGYNNIVTVLKDGELNDNAYAMIGKLFDSIGKTGDLLSGKDTYQSFEDSVGVIAQLFTNIPVKNLMRDARAMFNFITQPYAQRATNAGVMKYQMADLIMSGNELLAAINQRMGKELYDTSIDAYANRIYQADQRGDAQAAKEMRDYVTLVKSKAADPEKSLQQKVTAIAKKDDSISAAERAEYLTGNAGTESANNFVMDQIKKGEMTAEEGRKALKEIHPDKDANEIWWKVDRAEYARETGSETPGGYYYRLTDAVNSNSADEIRAAVTELLDHGVTQKQVKGKLSDWKKEYLAANADGKRRIRDAITKAYKAIGLTAEDAKKTIDGWKAK